MYRRNRAPIAFGSRVAALRPAGPAWSIPCPTFCALLCPRSAPGHKLGSTRQTRNHKFTLLLLGQFLADRLQFLSTLLRGLGICHLEIEECIEDDTGNNQPGIF